MVFLNGAHNLLRCKLLVVVYEYRCSRKPLSVELAPYSLAPASVGNGQMDAVSAEVVPVYASCEMAKGIQMVVCNHLRLAACSAGEIHQHGVLIGIDISWAFIPRSLLPLSVPVMEARSNGFPGLSVGVYCHEHLHCWALVHGSEYLRGNIFIVDAHYSLDACAVVAVDDVVLGKHVCSRYCHGSNLA